MPPLLYAPAGCWLSGSNQERVGDLVWQAIVSSVPMVPNALVNEVLNWCGVLLFVLFGYSRILNAGILEPSSADGSPEVPDYHYLLIR